MPLDRQGISSGAWSGRPPHRPSPQLPAFCRTRRPTTVAVTASSLIALRPGRIWHSPMTADYLAEI